MRFSKLMIVIPALVLMMASCGPHRPCMSHHGEPCHGGPGMGMAGGCGPDSCTYRSRCFSSGAVNTNGGVCQACSGGKWVEASGCSEGCGGCQMCHMHGGKKGEKPMPCMHGGHGGKGGHDRSQGH